MADLVSFPPGRNQAFMTTFPGAPLQSRTVGFPESGFDLGVEYWPFQQCLGLNVDSHIHPLHLWFTNYLVLLPYHWPSVQFHLLQTTKCPEVLYSYKALPLPHRYYNLMRQS